MSLDWVDQHLLGQMRYILAEKSMCFRGVEVDEGEVEGVVRLGYVPVSGDWKREMAQTVGAYVTMVEQGLESEQLEVAVFCPDCGEEVVLTYCVVSEWAEFYDQSRGVSDSGRKLIEKVMETVERRDH